VISPLLSNVYLNDVDTMLERGKAVTHVERWTYVAYARFADDLVVLVDGHPRASAVLSIRIPRRGQRENVRQIPVNASSPGQQPVTDRTSEKAA
jgi:RNA-directed DNA polymerase